MLAAFDLDDDSLEVEGLPGDQKLNDRMAAGSFALLCAIRSARGEAMPKPRRNPPMKLAEPGKRQLWPSWYEPPKRIKRGSELVKAIADDFGLTYLELRGTRNSYAVDARAVVAKILHERGMSYPQIAKAIGRKDHSTVMNSVENFEKYCQRNPFVRESYEKHTGVGL